jgi:tRNA wybutosine-synthesizing protein 1
VYRLTLVKDFNVEELENYAELVKRAKPEFIEVKGVTFSGDTKSNPLTMQNVPYHREVLAFCTSLAAMIPDYELACEHEHSCSVLIAHKKFKIDNEWHTWIDYERFNQLVNDPNAAPFTSLDYCAKTPRWAYFNSQEHGFDPQETRFHRNKKVQSEGTALNSSVAAVQDESTCSVM